jgi:hypothetical protein
MNDVVLKRVMGLNIHRRNLVYDFNGTHFINHVWIEFLAACLKQFTHSQT